MENITYTFDLTALLASNWRNIAKKLGIPEDFVEAIEEEEHTTDTNRMLRCMEDMVLSLSTLNKHEEMYPPSIPRPS